MVPGGGGGWWGPAEWWCHHRPLYHQWPGNGVGMEIGVGEGSMGAVCM